MLQVLGMELLESWSQLRKKSDATIWDLIPFALCWSIWMERNDVIFNLSNYEEDRIWDMHRQRLSWWIKARWKSCPYPVSMFIAKLEEISLPVKSKDRRNLEWIPPPSGLLKFNVDGASKGNPGSSGVGGVLRDEFGEVRGFFSKSVGVVWAFEAEVIAIRTALFFCKHHKVNNILVESDSSLAVGWVNCRSNRPSKLINTLNEIDWMRKEMNVVSISHVLRERNKEADVLAKDGCNRDSDLWVFHNP